jgi:hypothetical protein
MAKNKWHVGFEEWKVNMELKTCDNMWRMFLCWRAEVYVYKVSKILI